MIYVGFVLTVALAIVLDLLLVVVRGWRRPGPGRAGLTDGWHRRRRRLADRPGPLAGRRRDPDPAASSTSSCPPCRSSSRWRSRSRSRSTSVTRAAGAPWPSTSPGIGRAIPSYALLLVFFPIFGFGLLTPLLALVLLSIPPILANTYIGLRGVDREVVDAARGMGMRESAGPDPGRAADRHCR